MKNGYTLSLHHVSGCFMYFPVYCAQPGSKNGYICRDALHHWHDISVSRYEHLADIYSRHLAVEIVAYTPYIDYNTGRMYKCTATVYLTTTECQL